MRVRGHVMRGYRNLKLLLVIDTNKDKGQGVLEMAWNCCVVKAGKVRCLQGCRGGEIDRSVSTASPCTVALIFYSKGKRVLSFFFFLNHFPPQRFYLFDTERDHK